VPPAAKPKPPAPADKKAGKKKFFAIGALLTSTPFLIAIAIHGLLLVGGGSVVIFKGGNPLAIFTSQDVGDGDAGAEVEAPPAPEEPTPEEEVAPTAMETEVAPTETEESSDILALSTPSTVPSFAPPAPAKVAGPGTTPGSSVKMAAAPRPVGRPGTRRSGKSTLFGFAEKEGGELEGVMYDLKLKADGKKTTGMNWKTFEEEVKNIIRNRFRPSLLANYYRVEKKFFATMFYVPGRLASEAPEAFGVRGKVKPMFFIIHYSGEFAAPEDGKYRFVGLGDDSIVVLVDGTVRLEGNWNEGLNYSERDFPKGEEVGDFFNAENEEDRAKARLREGDWINMEAGKKRKIDIVMVEQGVEGSENGGRFAFVLLMQKQGAPYEVVGKGRKKFTRLPPFLLDEPDGNMKNVVRQNKDKLNVELDQALLFGVTPAMGGSDSGPVKDEPAIPATPTGRTDLASSANYGADWKDGTGATDGWEGWILRANGNAEKKSYAGFYIAKQEEKSGSASVATEGKSFAIFADGEGFQEATAFRGLAKPLEPNQTFSLDFVTPVPKGNSGNPGSLGLTLRNGKKADGPGDYNAGARFELTALEGQPNYQIFDGPSQSPDSGLAITPAGLRVELILKTADTYDLNLYPLSGGEPVRLKDRKLGGATGTPLESLAIFNRDSEQNAFFNRLRLNP